MKITECSVSGFGTISGKKYCFTNDLETILDENGSGKTTLAAFIKAMFYGLPDLRKTAVDDNDRIKYTPWQGGSFGGTLDFESKGKCYRIERTFGKNVKDDTFRIFSLDTGAECGDYTKDIGHELFGVSADSFEQSVFLSSSHREFTFPSDIRLMLTGINDSEKDLDNLDKALKKIDAARLRYRKLKGKGGLIDDCEKEVAERTDEYNTCKTALKDYCAAAKKLEDLRADASKDKAELDRVNELSGLTEKANARRKLEETLKSETDAAAEITVKYNNGFPSPDKISAVNGLISSLASDEQTIGNYENRQENGKLDEYRRFFENGVPTDEEIELLSETRTKLELAKLKIDGIESDPPDLTEEKPSVLMKILLVIGILLIAAGTVTAAAAALIPGIVIAAAGIVLTAVSAVRLILSKKRAAEKEKTIAEHDRTLSREKADRDKLLESIAPILDRYGASGTAGEKIAEITKKRLDYNALTEAENMSREEYDGVRRRANESRHKIREFFLHYLGNVPENTSDALFDIRNDNVAVAAIEKNISSCKAEIVRYDAILENAGNIPPAEELERKAQELTASIEEKRGAYSMLKSNAEALRLTAERISDAEQALESAKEKLEDSKKTFDVLKLTTEYLEKAKDNLTEKYKQPMTEGFSHYLKIVTESSSEFLIDPDLKVSYSEDGAMREKSYYSTGLRDMTDICMRLAMIDAMYNDNEKPPLILDDPFVNLDDRHLKNALKLLKKLSEDRRIIYLTCHSSRMP